MNDFLSNLATRSLNPMAAIPPRLPSLFEPPRAVSGMALEPEVLEGEEAAIEPEIEASPPTTRLRGPLLSSVDLRQPSILPTPDNLQPAEIKSGQIDRPASERRPLQAALERPVLTPEMASPGQLHRTGAVSQQRVIQPEPQPTIEPAPRSVVVGPVTSPGETQPQAAPGSDLSPAQAVPPLAPPAVEARPPVTLAPRGEPAARSVAVESVIPPGEVQPQVRATTVVARPQVTPAPRSEPVPPSVTAQPATELEPAPIIRVTIGRVEVRAVMPPPAPPPRRAAPPTPKLSLDEYLKRRSGGRQ